MTRMTRMARISVFTIMSFMIILLIFVISLVFSGRVILPQAFSLGPVTIHFYGITMALAVMAGFYWAVKSSPAYGIGKKAAEDMLFWAVIFGFIGARAYHVLSSIGYYWAHPIDIFKVWNGGLSIYGAAIAGFLTLVIYLKNNKSQPSTSKPMSRVTLDMMDWLVPSFAIGQIIGRMGNFFNYEAFGYPTNLPWKMFVPVNFRPEGFSQYQFFHPWFLYEQLGIILIFFALWPLYKKDRQDGQGRLFFFYLILYNILRFSLEFIRIDSTFIGGLRLNSVISLLLALCGLAGLIATYKHVKKTQP